ncbi:MAG TPA: dihydrofolate reductase family protein, partial [Segetibacter sp.]|nr:dihydrofolate reductase family protein [Segetibacter sp.]
MRKLIGAINMTLDGFCDHTAVSPDEEVHQHYADLISSAAVILYGRITYQLMEYWQEVVSNPTGNKSIDHFAVVMDKIPKIVFSNTLKDIAWESAKLASRELEEEVLELKQQTGKDILVGSRSLIVSLLKRNLLDEFQLCIHPVVAGKGLPLFENIERRVNLTLSDTKTFGSGAQILYY